MAAIRTLSRLCAPRFGKQSASSSIQQTAQSRTTSNRHIRQYSTRRSFPALFVRGGTSNGLVIKRDDLPPQDRWRDILPSAMGSPDPHGRQLNGVGSGISSTSKICIISPSERPDADVDFTFVQVGVKDGALDMAGNCGNMSAAVGPRAWDLGLVPNSQAMFNCPRSQRKDEALVRIFNTNTSKIMHSRFRIAGNPSKYCQEGDYAIDGVPGTQSRITLGFLNPAGAKTGQALPTGNATDILTLRDGSKIEASLVDVSNPGVFIRASDLGISDHKNVPLTGLFTPAYVEGNPKLKARLELIRQAGAEKMSLDPAVESVPKIVTLFRATHNEDIDIRCLALSMGQAHKAVPLTLALCLGAAANMPGTIPAQLARPDENRGSTLRIGHPSGNVEIGTTFEGGHIVSAELHRTARYLMEGVVYY
ncbi:methylitaconate delta2-delta3-isomerase [Apiospora arundinis]|uniref:3-methylitaconate isomerase n=1 Tax=Apiospora arundinis TaxID=335852 RepID=A0ABR2J9T9_9PEZI